MANGEWWGGLAPETQAFPTEEIEGLSAEMWDLNAVVPGWIERCGDVCKVAFNENLSELTGPDDRMVRRPGVPVLADDLRANPPVEVQRTDGAPPLEGVRHLRKSAIR